MTPKADILVAASPHLAWRRLQQEREAEHFHPLEAIEFFRRWPRSFVRNFIYTIIFNALISLAFTMMPLMLGKVRSIAVLAEVLGANLIIGNAIGFMFWAVFAMIGPLLRRLNRCAFYQIVLGYTLLGTGIVTLSFFILSQFPPFNQMKVWVLSPQQLLSSFIIALFISFVIGAISRNRAQELASQFALADERERTEAAERAATKAQLAALQAQIEPHFLFNTLANVTGLIHTKPDQAKLMLEKFIDYLRANLAESRQQSTTLAREFALMEKFLAIVQGRMGERLRVIFDLPDDARDFALPPMLLQPLVENAIKHGLEPKIDGGEIFLSAHVAGDNVEITVADTGRGFGETTTGGGMGLANVRERLQKLFDGCASVSVEDNQPTGARIVLRLPRQTPRQ